MPDGVDKGERAVPSCAINDIRGHGANADTRLQLVEIIRKWQSRRVARLHEGRLRHGQFTDGQGSHAEALAHQVQQRRQRGGPPSFIPGCLPAIIVCPSTDRRCASIMG